MSIGCSLHFRRDMSYNVGIIPALNPGVNLEPR